MRETFAEYMNESLYGKNGYYSNHVKLGGSGGDFFTASQYSLFAKVLARYAKSVWEDFGSPSQFQIVEYGAGQGELAAGLILELLPFFSSCGTAFLYSIQETSAHLRQVQHNRLSDLLADSTMVSWGRPEEDTPTLLLGNEVLDALPVERVKRTRAGYCQAYVNRDDGNSLEWQQATDAVLRLAKEWLPIPLSGEAEICTVYPAFFRACAEVAHTQRALFIDYGITKEEWESGVRPQGTVRAFRGHEFVSPLSSPGFVDITADVHWDYAIDSATKAGYKVRRHESQGSFLMNAGILDVLQSLEVTTHWTLQLKQLVLPGGMGERFWVLELEK